MRKIEIINYSPFDDYLPMRMLQEAFAFRLEESEQITNKVTKNLLKQTFSIDDYKKGVEKVRLVVDSNDDFIKNYKNGVIKLAKEKGKLVAQIKENGKYGEKLAIKEETYFDGPDSLEIMNAFQLQNIAGLLQDLNEQIQAIDENVKEVIKGLENDRLGLYYSGVSLYCEAALINDKQLKKQLIIQSLKTLSDANYQLTLNIQSDINYLSRKEYDKNKKQKFNLMIEKVNSINKAFSAIHHSTLMKAGIYCELGELNSMICVFNEYTSFIKNVISPNAKLLTQCDIGDTGKLDGTWSNRALLLNKFTNIVNQLSLINDELYIEYKGEEYNESI